MLGGIIFRVYLTSLSIIPDAFLLLWWSSIQAKIFQVNLVDSGQTLFCERADRFLEARYSAPAAFSPQIVSIDWTYMG